MSTSLQQLVFEGPDPERLLLEAWSVHGTSVRIGEPVRVRKGGVLGFFAKLHYRIEVQPSTSAMATGAQGADEMTASSPQAPASSPTTLRDQREPAPGAGSLGALEALVEATEDLVELDTSERQSFDAILEKVASSLGEDPGVRALPDLSTSPPMPVNAPRAARHGALQEASRPASAPEQSEDVPEPDRLDGPEEHRGSSRVLAHAPGKPVLHRAVTLDEGTRVLRARSNAPSASCDEAVLNQLVRIGFPLALLEGRPAPASLAEAFALAPSWRPLPVSSGSLVAIVGEITAATQLARQLASDLGLSRHEVALAYPTRSASTRDSHLVCHSVREALDRSPGWRRDRIGLVALGSSSPPRDTGWTRAMLRALVPSLTWAIASAMTKAEDLAAYGASIGGVDALVLEDVACTITPAAVLASGIAVARLDGAPAHAEQWAACAAGALARQSEAS